MNKIIIPSQEPFTLKELEDLIEQGKKDNHFHIPLSTVEALVSKIKEQEKIITNLESVMRYVSKVVHN